jgi:hypothetical protein
MANKEINTLLADILNVVTKHTAVLNDLQSRVNLLSETLENVYQRVEDMSKKYDEVLNTGLKKPKIDTVKKNTINDTDETVSKKKKTAVKKELIVSKSGDVKQIKNVMTYFKSKYMENQNLFNTFLEENQASALFTENADALSNKTGIAKIKEQANLLYKNLTAQQKKKIREKMLDEIDAASVNNDDDIEEENSD